MEVLNSTGDSAYNEASPTPSLKEVLFGKITQMRKFVFVTLPMWINVPMSLWSNFFNFLNEEIFFNNYVLMEIFHQRGK